jgi:AbrB family looped-hinge helix DNA binding protein
MDNKEINNERYMGSVKVGLKGQIVIPKEVRDMFNIKTGDSLVLLADAQKGIAIERMSVFHNIADTILEGRAKEMYPEHTESDSINFAKSIKKLEKTESERQK